MANFDVIIFIAVALSTDPVTSPTASVPPAKTRRSSNKPSHGLGLIALPVGMFTSVATSALPSGEGCTHTRNTLLSSGGFVDRSEALLNSQTLKIVWIVTVQNSLAL